MGVRRRRERERKKLGKNERKVEREKGRGGGGEEGEGGKTRKLPLTHKLMEEATTMISGRGWGRGNDAARQGGKPSGTSVHVQYMPMRVGTYLEATNVVAVRSTR